MLFNSVTNRMFDKMNADQFEDSTSCSDTRTRTAPVKENYGDGPRLAFTSLRNISAGYPCRYGEKGCAPDYAIPTPPKKPSLPAYAIPSTPTRPNFPSYPIQRPQRPQQPYPVSKYGVKPKIRTPRKNKDARKI